MSLMSSHFPTDSSPLTPAGMSRSKTWKSDENIVLSLKKKKIFWATLSISLLLQYEWLEEQKVTNEKKYKGY